MRTAQVGRSCRSGPGGAPAAARRRRACSAADKDWRAAVDELIGRAAVVLLHAGEGDGFAWEAGT